MSHVRLIFYAAYSSYFELVASLPLWYTQRMPEIFNASSTQKTAVVTQSVPLKPNQAIERLKKNSEVLRESHQGGHALSAYCVMPKNISFEIQHEEETVLMMLRQHPIVNVPWIVLTLLLLIAPFFSAYFPIITLLPLRFQTFTIIGWYLLTLGFALQRFIMWFYNVYLITDERIIDVDFFSLIYKRISEAKIENIEDITASGSGVLQTVVDYGDIQIQTAAEIPEIEFEKVPHPQRVMKFISELMDEEERERAEGRTR